MRKVCFSIALLFATCAAQAQPYHCESTNGFYPEVYEKNLKSTQTPVMITIHGQQFQCEAEPPPPKPLGPGPGGMSGAGYNCPRGWWPVEEQQSKIFCTKPGAVIMIDPWTNQPGVIRDGFHNGPGGKHLCAVNGLLVTC